ncbi:hypothetical protein E2C01_055025 [Portunus trituberculatus]|uniref:Uncharacterized protein n=1 Tax=Portunus trituberculatus TaxID=210409 RepID=A0A5B7GTK9_PORTR|nr:hypothetical protein [Portunus trituberculatus]
MKALGWWRTSPSQNLWCDPSFGHSGSRATTTSITCTTGPHQRLASRWVLVCTLLKFVSLMLNLTLLQENLRRMLFDHALC